MDCTIYVAKTKALISFAVTAKLICVFVFAYAKCWFSHDAAHLESFYSLYRRLKPHREKPCQFRVSDQVRHSDDKVSTDRAPIWSTDIVFFYFIPLPDAGVYYLALCLETFLPHLQISYLGEVTPSIFFCTTYIPSL